MSKKKRPQIKIAPTKKNISHTQQEHCYLAAKKILRHFELEPELVDVFSKNQKQRLFKNYFEPPIVKPDMPKTMPRQYVKNFHAEMYQFMKNNYFGNPENQLTYMELAVHGLNFLLNLSNMHVRDGVFITGTIQEEAAKHICEKYQIEDFFYKIAFKEVLEHIWGMTRKYSKVNFRFYGFKLDYDHIPQPCGCCINMKMTIRLTAQNSESKKFIYNKIERIAYRMFAPAVGIYKAALATVSKNKIYPKSKEDEQLNIYIQSHVLYRFKERMDGFDPSIQNLLIQYAFTTGMHLVTVDKQILFSCLIEDEKPVGYFTFFVQDNDVVINTFIPLSSENTPEGKKFHQLLPLSKEEMVFLGMDKISFYLSVDFEQIPKLKQALVDSKIWETKLVLDDINNRESEKTGKVFINEGKTVIVKNFFDKREQYNAGMEL